MSKEHNCALFKRKKQLWKWEQGGTIQSYPMMKRNVIVAFSKTQFSYTQPIIDVVEVIEDERAVEVVFQDENDMWKLIFPRHTNNIDDIKKSLGVK